MIRSVGLLLVISNIGYSFQITELKDGSIAFYMEGDRKVIHRYVKPTITLLEKPILPIYVEPVKTELSSSTDVKNKFASKDSLKSSGDKLKEKINSNEEAVKFFESINKKDIKPVNIEK